jgi:hypothetical protein
MPQPNGLFRFELNNALSTILVPEPLPLLLVGVGLIGLGIVRRYRKK